ncbi:DinB/UmuC family translesion DNA polymerase [Desulfonatronum parangueonense]
MRPSFHWPCLQVITRDLIRASLKALKQIFKTGYEYRKAGVMVFGIKKEHGRRLSLFEPPPEERARCKAVIDVIDRVNAKWGL